MNTKEKAITDLIDFLKTEDQVLLFTGTHQNVKHVLAFQAVLLMPNPYTILFRTGNARDYETYLSSILKFTNRPKSGTKYSLRSGQKLYLDTINSASWSKTPRSIDLAIVYPIDVVDEREGDRIVNDLIGRKAEKIILVSWTDNKKYSWAEQFNPRKVIYDAEAERPEYHNEMLKLTARHSVPSFVHNLPQYAESTPHEYLIRILCRDCHKTRWAKMNKPFTGITAIKKAGFGEIEALCLKCGYRATDSYNWSR